ncbi:hypothetical protein T310_0505 [Rasamsonia emersonii CBS 393.64]|uniref:Uncharacterized protein n=1 Tax=Rasamsonia emersonii (strain ATCC 16479 / CBS 393.64 / IMI 116815) TaxID=1408163 RepID=A0A0F4Z5V1_RASE3|nr:hypothetical protein T310_0505 [Rasamsonia emersonii CBS 393.64]KKA25481.1 hypothetical protein T310_0505 [Rasamsonia emersonii CBS 393.64]
MDVRRAWNANPTTIISMPMPAPIHTLTPNSFTSDHLTITDIQDRMDIDSAETDVVMSDLTEDEEEHPLDADSDTVMTGAPRYNSPCGSPPYAPAPAVPQNALGAQYINGPLKRPQSMPYQAKRPPFIKHRLDRDRDTVMIGVPSSFPSPSATTRPYRQHRVDRDGDTIMTGVPPPPSSTPATRPYRHRLDRDQDTIMTGTPSFAPAPAAKPRYRQQQHQQQQQHKHQQNRPASGPNQRPQAACRSPPRRNPYPTPPPTPRPSPSGPAPPASSPSSTSSQRGRYRNSPRMSKKGSSGAGRSTGRPKNRREGMVNGQRRNTNKTESVWHGTGTSGKTTFWNLYHATEKERIFVEEEERNGWHEFENHMNSAFICEYSTILIIFMYYTRLTILISCTFCFYIISCTNCMYQYSYQSGKGGMGLLYYFQLFTFITEIGITGLFVLYCLDIKSSSSDQTYTRNTHAHMHMSVRMEYKKRYLPIFVYNGVVVTKYTEYISPLYLILSHLVLS